SALHSQNSRIKVSNGLISKRIIYAPGYLYLLISTNNYKLNFINSEIFLSKLTVRFTKDRVLRKLSLIYPGYKNTPPSPLNRNNLQDSQFWIDYCNIFDSNGNQHSYKKWISDHETPSRRIIEHSIRHLNIKTRHPFISIILPVYNPNLEWLSLAIDSVRSQTFENWELCISDDGSTNPEIKVALLQYSNLDDRIRTVFLSTNNHISSSSNAAIKFAHGDWIALLDHDDLLSKDALCLIASAIFQKPDLRLIYSDVDKIDEIGNRSGHYFKSDWNPDLFLSQNMISHLGVYRTDLVRSVGGFRVGLEGSQDYDLALRCIEQIKPEQIHHIPRVLYHWRMHADSTAHDLNAKPYAIVAGERALNDHFKRIGSQAWAETVKEGYRVHYPLPAPLPLVSLIIPTRNGLKLLKQCIDSILQKTDYSHYEIIIVDNGSDDSATLRYLRKIVTDPRIRVIRDDRPFNYSALNNRAVREARGEIIGLINNDIEVITPEWLSEMVSHAVRPEVGAVGARLWYSDDTIQHAGIILGMMGFAGHAHRYLPKGNPGYCGRAALIQSFSAVTGACLVVRKELYELVGGLNEIELQVACNDVDFCLKLREAGYRNIWTPYAELYHHESSSRGFDDTPEKVARAEREVAYMWAHWGPLLENDPAYNPNLSLDNEDFTLAWPPRLPGILSDIDETVTQQ
ncbi:MAG TPA: glycosyltransferase family 2 protein, partial [Halothiobacillus sp.]|nr:glycosyltransferase family 2 protein [Halothiobacillus sp.]